MKSKSFSIAMRKARQEKEWRMRELPGYFIPSEIEEPYPIAILSPRKMR